MAEAVGLVNTLDNWRVVDTIILSTKTPEKKRIFGKGNFQSLTGIVPLGQCPPVNLCSVSCLLTVLLSFCVLRENQANIGDHSCVCECGETVSTV